MLRLEADKSNHRDEQYKTPKYIQLTGAVNILGRGYQAHIRLPFAWLSRKHATITRVDGNCIIEAHGQNGVFVNNKRVEFTRLSDGDTISIGGGRKINPVGSSFQLASGPYIIYSYHKSAKEMKGKENCYHDTTKPEDVMQLQDLVNGQMVNTSYHLEDFNCTDELTAADNVANITVVNESFSTVPMVSKIANPILTTSNLESVYESNINTERTKSSSSQLPCPVQQPAHKVIATATLASTPSSSTTKLMKPPVSPIASPKWPRPGAVVKKKDALSHETSVVGDKPNSISSPLISKRAGRKGRAAATACKKMLSGLGKGDQHKPEFNKADKKKPNGKKYGRQKKATTISRSETDFETKADVKPDVNPNVKSEPPSTVSNSVSMKSEPKSEVSLKDEPDVKMSEIESAKIKPTRNLEALSDKDMIKTSKVILTEDLDTDKGCCMIEKTSSQCLLLDAESDEERDAQTRRSSRKRKRIFYNINSQSGEDSDYLPDPEDSTKILDDEDDLNVLPVVNLKAIIHPLKRQRIDKTDQISFMGGGKGKATGRGKSKNKRCAPLFDPEEERVLKSWFNKVLPRPAPRMVEVLNGTYRRSLYAFNDQQMFQVVYKKGEDKSGQNLWETEEYDVIVNLDAALFEYKLKLGQLDQNDLTRVLRLIRRSATTLNIKDYDKPTPATKIRHLPQPDAVTIQLKQYQLDTLGWMNLVESQVNRKWSLSKLADWPEAEIDLAFDVVNKRVYFPPVPSIPSTEYKVSIKGGILADEMGLGKTITLLSLIATHQDMEMPRIPTPDVFRNHEELQIPTRATLVIAPSHLTAQWQHEAETHAPSFNIILITTKPQFEKYTYADILRADIVVVSVQFLLTNKAYTTLPSGADAETSFMNLLHKSGINPLLQKAPNFGHFNWWRLVCDEAHELITYESKYSSNKKGSNHYEIQPSNGLLMLEKLNARHKWYMTGTPLPHAEKSLRGALKFLEMKIDDPSLTYADGSLKVDQDSSSLYSIDIAKDELYFSPIHKFILDTIYVRNTKQSIGMEYNVPEYVEELMLLTMSEVEKGIYDRAANEREQRQLCCHLQIASRVQMIAGVQQKTLEEVKDAMILHTRMEIDKTRQDLVSTKEAIKTANAEIAMEDKASMRHMLESRIKRFKDNLKSYEDSIKRNNSSLSYFENIVPRVTQSADEPCVICMDNIETLTLTPCGHLYCKKCIQPYIQRQPQCPTCRKHCTESQLIEVKDPRQRENLNKSAELQNLTEQFGTKMAYLIFYLRHLFKNDPKSRVIVFSQWDELLHKIGSTLNDNGIRNVFVKGNVHVRNKAIMSFRKQEKTRVIMLSLQNAASGTNLVEASHVILIDPVAGSKQEAVSIESQAIGRAHRMGQDKEITVVRMIIQDTIEHELYLRNNSDNIQQVELNFDDQADVCSHGPQVIRKVRKVPKPTVDISAVSVFANDGSSTSTAATTSRTMTSSSSSHRRRTTGSSGRKKRGWGSWGFGRRRRFWDFDNYFDEQFCGNECDCPSCNDL